MTPLSNDRSEGGALVRPQQIDYIGSQNRPDEPAPGGLLEYWRIIQRRRGTVILVAGLGLVAGFLYTLPQTPVYQAQTVIEVQGMNEDFMHMKEVNPMANTTSGWDPTIELQTQVRVLQSRDLLDRVVKRLDRQNVPRERPVSRWDLVRKILGLPSTPTSGNSLIRSAAAALRIRVQANTRLIDIRCDSIDPRVAADFSNALTAEFIEQNLEARWKTTEHTGQWLAHQMEDLKIKLERAEDAMQGYARQSGLTFTQEKDNITEQKLKQLQEELSKAQAERVSRQSRYELLTAASPDSLGELLDDASLKDMQGKITDLRRQLAELSTEYKSSYPKVSRIQAQIAPLETALQQARSNILNRIRNDFESARRRESLLAQDYAATAKLVNEQADKVTHYNILKRDVDSYRQMYDNMLQRVKEAGIASALRASNIRIVDPADVPTAPYKPNLLNNTVLGLLGGILMGLVVVVFLDRANRTIQEPGDLGYSLGVAELGTIPSGSLSRRPVRALGPSADAEIRHELVAMAPRSTPMSEAIRAALTSILFSCEDTGGPRVLVMSSAAPREGKTTLCTNLAIALAGIHRRVLLIDADMRKPRIHNLFDFDNDAGLVDILRRNEPITGLNGEVRSTSIPNLFVMTSGRAKTGETTLLHSQRLAELIRYARDTYDTVLIDTPPMLAMADARVIAKQADGVVLVARAQMTSRDGLREAHDRFRTDGINVVGAILNDWNPRRSNRYGYYKYYDQYRHYYSDASQASS